MRKPDGGSPPVTRTLLVADLVRLPEYQMRRDRKGDVRLNLAKVAEYANAYKAGSVLPPVSVAVVGGAPIVTDGWHRLAALERNGQAHVDAQVYQGVTAQTALWMAAQANLDHGVPLDRAGLRRVFNALIKSRRHIKARGRLHSYREIAAMLGNRVQHTTVRHWMLSDHPKVARQMGGLDPVAAAGAEFPRIDQQEALAASVAHHLKSARAAATGLTAPARRGRAITDLREVLAELEAGGTWTVPEQHADF